MANDQTTVQLVGGGTYGGDASDWTDAKERLFSRGSEPPLLQVTLLESGDLCVERNGVRRTFPRGTWQQLDYRINPA